MSKTQTNVENSERNAVVLETDALPTTDRERGAMHKAQTHERARNDIERVVRPEVYRADTSKGGERKAPRAASEVPEATAEDGSARTIKGGERLESLQPVRKELAAPPVQMPAGPLEVVRRVGSHRPPAADEHFQGIEDGNRDVLAKSGVQGGVPAATPGACGK